MIGLRLLIAAALAVGAQPTRPASTTLLDLERRLHDARLTFDRLVVIRMRLKPLYAKMHFSPERYFPQYSEPTDGVRLQELSASDRALFRELKASEAAAAKAMREAHQAAINATAREFRINARPRSGPILEFDSSDAVPLNAEFDMTPHRVENGRLQTPEEVLEEPSYIAFGPKVISIRESAFKSPGYLAFCLEHECSHLERAVAGPIMTTKAEEELRASLVTLPLLRTVFDLDPEDWARELMHIELFIHEKEGQPRSGTLLAHIPIAVKRALIALDADTLDAPALRKSANLRLFGILSDDQLNLLREDWRYQRARYLEMRRKETTAGEYGSVKRVLDEVVAAGQRVDLKEANDDFEARLLRERQRFEQDAPRRAAEEAEQRRRYLAHLEAEDEHRRAEWRYLKSVAKLACSDPKSMTSGDYSDRFVPVSMSPSYLGGYISWEYRGPGSLSWCQIWVLQHLESALWKGQTASTRNIADWAREYRRAHPGIFGAIGAALKEVGAALQDLVNSPGDPPGETAHHSAPSRNEARCATDPSTGVRGCCVIGCQ